MINYISSIIDPIISRCAMYRFKEIPTNQIKLKLENIIKEEQIKLPSPDVLNLIIKNSNSDFRKAINILEMVSYFQDGYPFILMDIPENIIEKIIKITLSQSHIKLNNVINDIIFQGYDCRKLLEIFVNMIITLPISEESISLILLNVAKSENLLVKKGSEYIELCNVFQLLLNLPTSDKKILKKLFKV